MSYSTVRENNRGFSLVELVIVIAIMAILMGVLAPTLIGNVERSRESTDLQNLDALRGTIVTIMADDDVYMEVMDAASTADPLLIDLGDGDIANFSNIIVQEKFRDAMLEHINKSIETKSTVASANDLYIEVTKTGEISVFIAESDAESSADAVACKSTFESDGKTPKKFLAK